MPNPRPLWKFWLGSRTRFTLYCYAYTAIWGYRPFEAVLAHQKWRTRRWRVWAWLMECM